MRTHMFLYVIATVKNFKRTPLLRFLPKIHEFLVCNQKLSHYICSDHMKFIVIHGEIKVEKQNMGHVHSKNEKKAHICFLTWLPR